jgi:hypothetical protein
MESDLKDWLLEIVQEEEWDESELVEWVDEFMRDRCNNEMMGYMGYMDEDRTQQEKARIVTLKPLVSSYQHDQTLPELPQKPDGSLYGIGFIYDQDRDDRVLVAIDKLKGNRDVVVLAEREGVLEIYSRMPTNLTGLSVFDDEWNVTEYIPYRGKWIEVDQQFIRNCVEQVIDYKKPASA